MTTRSIDQMVEAAIWLMVQGDRAGAEELLAQVLRIDPTHERARQAMKSTGAQTSPGQELPKAPVPQQTVPMVPPGLIKLPETRTPVEPLPAHAPAEPPSEPIRRTTLPGTGEGRGQPATVLSDMPFKSSPSAAATADEDVGPETGESKLPDEIPEFDIDTAPTGQRVKEVRLAGVESRTEQLSALPPRPSRPEMTPSMVWTLEVLTGPHAGAQITVRKTAMLGRGLGALPLDDDPFVSPAHASFAVRQGDLYVTDGGSASGTWVTIDSPTRIAPGGGFSAGLQRFTYLGPVEQAKQESPVPYGAPRPQASWRLEHCLVGGRGGRVWVLRGGITLGRSGVHLQFPDDESMALAHVEMRPAGAELELIDKAARAGTFVLLPPGSDRKLVEGQRVRLGSTVLRIAIR